MRAYDVSPQLLTNNLEKIATAAGMTTHEVKVLRISKREFEVLIMDRLLYAGLPDVKDARIELSEDLLSHLEIELFPREGFQRYEKMILSLAKSGMISSKETIETIEHLRGAEEVLAAGYFIPRPLLRSIIESVSGMVYVHSAILYPDQGMDGIVEITSDRMSPYARLETKSQQFKTGILSKYLDIKGVTNDCSEDFVRWFVSAIGAINAYDVTLFSGKVEDVKREIQNVLKASGAKGIPKSISFCNSGRIPFIEVSGSKMSKADLKKVVDSLSIDGDEKTRVTKAISRRGIKSDTILEYLSPWILEEVFGEFYIQVDIKDKEIVVAKAEKEWHQIWFI